MRLPTREQRDQGKHQVRVARRGQKEERDEGKECSSILIYDTSKTLKLEHNSGHVFD